MLSRKQITRISSLQHKKYRDKYGEFIVEGPKLVAELLKSDFHVSAIFVTGDHQDWVNNQTGLNITPALVSESDLRRISHFTTPNGILAVIKQPTHQLNKLNYKEGFVLMLDGISDPGNLGTIIRTAEWFGINNIICSNNCVELYNSKVVQSTMGSLFRTKVYYADLLALLPDIRQQVPVFGTFLNGENIYDQDFDNSGVLVIGSESHGISPGVANFIDKRLHIPSVQKGAESLNASVATAICCSEINKNQLKKI